MHNFNFEVNELSALSLNLRKMKRELVSDATCYLNREHANLNKMIMSVCVSHTTIKNCLKHNYSQKEIK